MQNSPSQKNDQSTLIAQYQIAMNPSDLNYAKMMKLLSNFPSDQEPLQPKPPLTCVALQGGGAKGAAYCGVMETLENYGYLDEIDYISGASAGAITSFIIGLGFNGEQFKYISDHINFLDFNDLKPEGWGAYFGGNKIGIGIDAVQSGAAYTGEAFHHWSSFLVEQVLGDPNATFSDLHEKRELDPTLKDIVFKATRYQAKKGEYIEQTFSYIDTPNIRIADAVRASMAFPGAFSPHVVRDKEGQVFGIFADGGILNNYPIDVFNAKQYYDKKYSPIERQDHHGKQHQINPCSVGLSLTDLQEIDNAITPMTDRLKEIKEKTNKKPRNKDEQSEQLTKEEISEMKEDWAYFDIISAVWWNKVGVAIKEQIVEKQKLYHDQTIQIWPENVGTLEFDVSKEKLKQLEASGSNATKLWLDKFRDPTKAYSLELDDRLSQTEKKLKKNNPADFYEKKLTEYFLEFNREMAKAIKQDDLSDDNILKNVRLQYITFKINKMIEQIKSKEQITNTEEITQKAFKNSGEMFHARNTEVATNRDKRFTFIQLDKLAHHVSEKFIDKPDEAIRILQGQLSNILPLVCTKIDGQNLLGFSIQTGNEIVVEQMFKIISNVIMQCHYQGRINELNNSLADMLNNTANPPVFESAAKFKTTQMTKLLLQYGADPLLINKKTGKNGLQEMVLNGNYQSFKIIVNACIEDDGYFIDYPFGDESLMHFIFKNADEDFIKTLSKDHEFLKKIMNHSIPDADGNTIEGFTSRLAESPTDLRWQMVAQNKTLSYFEATHIAAEKKFEKRDAEKKWAEKSFNSLNTKNLSEKISEIEYLSAKTCLDILKLTTGDDILLCTLVQNPQEGQTLKLLCEKAYSDSSTSLDLMHLLNQKWRGKTPLYLAAKAGNHEIVTYLREPKYDMKVNDAGPVRSSCALLVAARNGHLETVKAILNSNPNTRYVSGLRGYQPIEYDKRDAHGRNTLHYLAMHGTPELFCAVLYGNTMPSNIATAVDQDGKTPLTYLIEHNRIDILQAIIAQGKGMNKGYIQTSDYYFDELFLWQDRPTEGFSDLVFAKHVNEDLYKILYKNLSSNVTKKENIHKKVESVMNQLEKEQTGKQKRANEVVKLQLISPLKKLNTEADQNKETKNKIRPASLLMSDKNSTLMSDKNSTKRDKNQFLEEKLNLKLKK